MVTTDDQSSVKPVQMLYQTQVGLLFVTVSVLTGCEIYIFFITILLLKRSFVSLAFEDACM
jgi:hypothetical protein